MDILDYDRTAEVYKRQPRRRNLLSHILRLQTEERIYYKNGGESGSRLFMRSEMKNSAGLNYVVQRLRKPGYLVVDTRTGTFSFAKACMLLSKHRRFISCKVDLYCSTKTTPELVLLSS